MFAIVLARQGQTMEQGTLVRWCTALDQTFAIGDDLYEIESEKALIVIQATRPGRIVRHLASPDEVVPVGALLAIAAEIDETVTPDAVDRFAGQQRSAVVADEPGSEDARAAASNSGGPSRSVTAVPKARALARELGIELASVVGTGPNGAVTVDDVRAHGRAGSRASEVSLRPVSRRVPHTPIRRSILAALDRGARVPQFTQGILVDASGLVQRKKAAAELSFLDLFLDAIVIAARAVPDVLAHPSERETEYFSSIDISIAAATESGLLLPVLRDAGAMSIDSRATAWRALIERARAGRMTANDTGEGTIALSNLGTRGVDYGTPLLPAGHAAIVFVGSIAARPLVIDGRLEARQTVHVSITYDHRVVDGVLGSQFTSTLRDALERNG